MRYFSATTADLIWQEAATELINHPDYQHRGRNGGIHEIVPCVLRIEDPRQRWIVSRYPPYNPAIGLVEFIWLLTGNNESRVLNYWNPSLPKYAGNDDVYHGAYGFRLRNEFGLDQIKRAYHVLSNSPETRQVILQIWKPELDLPTINGQPASTDIPCNVMSLLKLREGRLHWSQIMRSNDIMRGLPYDIIQFTMLQEIMASWLGAQPGEYIHISDSLHLYEKDMAEFRCSPNTAKNTKRVPFAMAYNETNELFSQIYEDLAKVSNGNKKNIELKEIFDRDSERNLGRCEFVQDLMAVIGSDAARRQNYTDLSYDLADSCVDSSLKRASHAWLEYHEGKK